MNALLRVELRRVLSRRLFRVTVLLGLLVVLAIDGVIAAKSSTDVAAAKAHAQAELNRQYAGCLAAVPTTPGQPGPTKADCDGMLPQHQVAECIAGVQAGQAPPGATVDDCRRHAGDNPFFKDPRFFFAYHGTDLLTSFAFLFMAVALVVAASLTGAEWQAGTFASLLTWEPRRQRVLAAKLLAPTVALSVVAAVGAAVFVAGGWLAADLRGTTAGTTGHVWWQLAEQYGRVVGLIALVSVIGAALGALTRHTVAAVGVVGGYLVGGELVGGLVSRWWAHHGLGAHLVALVRGSYDFPVRTATTTGFQETTQVLHAGSGAVIVTLIAVAAAGVAAVAVARRDVT